MSSELHDELQIDMGEPTAIAAPAQMDSLHRPNWKGGKGMIKYSKEWITPEIAAEMLASTGQRNRNLRRAVVATYAAAMRANEWVENPQPIAMNGSSLIDGQHRLHAIIQAGVAIEMWVARGVDPKAMTVIDQLSPKSAADVMGLHGIKYASRRVAIARQINRLDGDRSPRKLQAWEVTELLAQHPDAMMWAEQYFGTSIFEQSWLIGTAVWLYPHVPSIERFFERLVGGDMLAKDSPVLCLREWVLRVHAVSRGTSQFVRDEGSLRVCAAVSAFERGRPLTMIRLSSSDYERYARMSGMSEDRYRWAKMIVERSRESRRQKK